MILFGSDYLKYPNTHIHVETKNISFIRMWKILKSMGVKNNKFFLTLLDKELTNVDACNLKDPSLELRGRILTEIINNPWYYFREIVRISASGSISHFTLHRANLALIWLFLNHVDTTLIMPRQLGKTVGALCICSYVLFFRNFKSTIAVLTKDNKTRVSNVKKLIDMKDSLPQYLIISNPRDKKNSEEIYYEALDNRYDSYINKYNTIGAEALGRGLTCPIQHWDEFAFFRYNYISFPAAISSMNDAIDKAIENNQLRGLMITTTAGQLDIKEGKYVYDEFVTKAVPFDESFYDFSSSVELTNVVKTNSKNNTVLLEYNPLQLGRSIDWIKSKIQKIKSSPDTIKRDMFNIWTYTQAKRVLPQETIEKLKLNEKEPQYVQKIDDYLIYWYITPQFLHSKEFLSIPIAVGSDSSENVGRDYTTLVFMDGRDLSVLGTMRCNDSNIIQIGHLIANLLFKYPNMVFIPERNSVGVAIIDTILLDMKKHHIDPFLRIYNRFIEDKIDSLDDYRNKYFDPDSIPRSYIKTLGFRTDGKHRYILYKYVFKRAITYNYDKIYSKTLINEIVKLRINKNRIDHAAGKHDDLVIAYLLALYFFLYSSKLHIYFNNSYVQYEPLCNYREDKELANDIDKQQFKKILKEIKKTQDQLSKASTELEKVQFRTQLNYLKSMTSYSDEMHIDQVSSMNDISNHKSQTHPSDSIITELPIMV